MASVLESIGFEVEHNNYFDVDFAIDIGSNKVYIFDVDKDAYVSYSIKKINIEEIFKDFPNGSKITSELAHWTPQTLKSLAQPLTPDQIDNVVSICKDKNIDFRLFPQQVTPTARNLLRLKKSDENDLRAMVYYCANFDVKMKKMDGKYDYSPRQLEGFNMRKDQDNDFNAIRATKYSASLDKISPWVRKHAHVIAEMISEDARQSFKLLDLDSGRKTVREAYLSPVCSIVVMMMTLEGEPRLRPSTNALAGKKYAFELLCPRSAYHRSGGVVRSNFYNFCIPNYVGTMMNNKVSYVKKDGKNGIRLKRVEDYTIDEWRQAKIHMANYRRHMNEVYSVVKQLIEADFGL